MHLTPREQERLLIFVAADVARKRRARGLKLNYPEAIAISDGRYSGMGARRQIGGGDHDSGHEHPGRDDVMDGVAEMIHEVQVEATFPDGTKLVTVHDPIQ